MGYMQYEKKRTGKWPTSLENFPQYLEAWKKKRIKNSDWVDPQIVEHVLWAHQTQNPRMENIEDHGDKVTYVLRCRYETNEEEADMEHILD